MKSLIEILCSARELSAKKDYSAALRLLGECSGRLDLSVGYFLLKGRLILLSDGTLHDLAEAQQCYVNALRIEPDNSEVLLELGFFYSRVLSKPEEGREYFSKAMRVLVNSYAEAICGYSETIDGQPKRVDQFIEAEIQFLRESISKKM